MQIQKEDFELDSLIEIFNRQTQTKKWDEAYGTALAIVKAYRDRADDVEQVLVSQLHMGLINRAKQAAAKLVTQKSTKEKKREPTIKFRNYNYGVNRSRKNRTSRG